MPTLNTVGRKPLQKEDAGILEEQASAGTSLKGRNLLFFYGSRENGRFLAAAGQERSRVRKFIGYTIQIPVNIISHGTPDERMTLMEAGWQNEGIGFYSDPLQQVPVYRLFNPNAADAGSHMYTTSKNEANTLEKQGWLNKGIGWYAELEGTGGL